MGGVIASLNKSVPYCGGFLSIAALKHLKAAAVADALRAVVEKPDCQVHADDQNNSIFILTRSRAKSEQIELLIKTLDVEPRE